MDRIAKQQACITGEDAGQTALRIAQRISCTLQREHARAVLARVPVAEARPSADAWADVAWQ